MSTIPPPSSKLRFFRRDGQAGKPWDRGPSRHAEIREPQQIFLQTTTHLQVACDALNKLGIGSEQEIVARVSWDGSSCLVNRQRGLRPMASALKATERLGCPVCNSEKQPYWTWQVPGGARLFAYAPEQPHLPQQINIPLSPLHKTDLRDLQPHEFIFPLLFAKQVLSEQIAKVPESDPVAYIHLGGVGSSIVHPIMVVGALWHDAIFYNQTRFDIAARYWHLFQRDILWEEHQQIINGNERDLFIAQIGGNNNPNRGWLLHSPFSPLAPYHLRISALQEGTYNLMNLDRAEILPLGFAIWSAVSMLGKLTDGAGNPAINNVEINFSMISPNDAQLNPKARMHVEIIPRETQQAAMELMRIPVVDDPTEVAAKLKSLAAETPISFEQSAIIAQISAAAGIIRHTNRSNGGLAGRQPISLNVIFDKANNTHKMTQVSGDIETTVPFRWLLDKNTGTTSLIVPGGWSSGTSEIEFPQESKPSREPCFACDVENLGYPHYKMTINGREIVVVTNAFGFSGGQAAAEPLSFNEEIEVRLGHGLEKLLYGPSHLLAFTKDHLVDFTDLTPYHHDILVRIWHKAAKELFQKNPQNSRLVCFVNLGVEAGASIPHFHTQMVELPATVSGNIERRISQVDTEGRVMLRQKENNPYNQVRGLALLQDGISSRDLMAEIFTKSEQSGLVLFEDDNVIAYVEETPMFPYEMIIRAKRLGANSLLYLKPEELDSFIKAMGVMQKGFVKIGVNNINIVDESAQYDNRSSCWRYGIRFLPRKVNDTQKRIGALDLKGVFLVPVSPQRAAEEFKEAIGGLVEVRP